MKYLTFKTILFSIAFTFLCSQSNAQQFSVSVLLKTSFFGAKTGFPSIIKDTVSNEGEWNYSIRKDVVNHFADVKDIKIKFVQNHNSLLLNESEYNLYKMKICSEDIILPSESSMVLKNDTITSYFKTVLNFVKESIGSDVISSKIFSSQNQNIESGNPLLYAYIYEKSASLHENLSDRKEIEKQLDILTYMSVELFQNNENPEKFSIIFTISSGQE